MSRFNKSAFATVAALFCSLNLFASMLIQDVDTMVLSGKTIQEVYTSNVESAEGGEYSYFKSPNGDLIRIDADVYGETGQVAYRLYFLTRNKMFVKEKRCEYSQPLFYNGNTNPEQTCDDKTYSAASNDDRFSLYMEHIDQNTTIEFIQVSLPCASESTSSK